MEMKDLYYLIWLLLVLWFASFFLPEKVLFYFLVVVLVGIIIQRYEEIDNLIKTISEVAA